MKVNCNQKAYFERNTSAAFGATMSTQDRIHHLLPQAQDGSEEALGEVLQSCRAYLVMVAESEIGPNLRAKGGASDLVQQTFLEAQQHFDRFHGTTLEELRAWLRQILKNNLANFVRAYRYTAKRDVGREKRLQLGRSSNDWQALLDGDAETPSQQISADEQTAELQKAILRLPPDDQQIIHFRYREQLSFEEIAKHMHRSADALRKLWSRAVERLRLELERNG